MTSLDVSILEWLEENEMAAPPIQIYLYFPGVEDDRPRKPSIHRSLKRLREHGMVERHPKAESLYVISDKGSRYLNDDDATIDEFMPENNGDDADNDDETNS